jgi:hypothetical protein
MTNAVAEHSSTSITAVATCIHPGCSSAAVSECLICEDWFCPDHDCDCPVLDPEFYFEQKPASTGPSPIRLRLDSQFAA